VTARIVQRIPLIDVDMFKISLFFHLILQVKLYCRQIVHYDLICFLVPEHFWEAVFFFDRNRWHLTQFNVDLAILAYNFMDYNFEKFKFRLKMRLNFFYNLINEVFILAFDFFYKNRGLFFFNIIIKQLSIIKKLKITCLRIHSQLNIHR
jgi:hypothetical protein